MKFVMECGPCDGDKSYALDVVDLLAEAYPGVAMKVQFYTPETITSHDAARYDHTDERNLTQWELFSLTQGIGYDEWADIAEHAHKRGVEFFASVFSTEAVDKALEMGITTLKIASGDITNLDLIRHATRAPHLVVSTGASTPPEIHQAAELVHANDIFLACHLAYPSRGKDAHLKRLRTLQELIRHPVGYSDHTRGIETVAPLVAMGAAMWEKHFSIHGHEVTEGDHAFAIRSDELTAAQLIASRTEDLLGDWQLKPTASELVARLGARRSLASTEEILIGAPITEKNTALLRPATGLPPEALNIPMVARVHIPPYTTITADMVESP